MGNTHITSPLIPKDSPLDIVLRNKYWIKLNHLKEKELINYCTVVWPRFDLEGGEKWPRHGSFNAKTVLQLVRFCKERRWLRTMLPYVDAFVNCCLDPLVERAISNHSAPQTTQEEQKPVTKQGQSPTPTCSRQRAPAPPTSPPASFPPAKVSKPAQPPAANNPVTPTTVSSPSSTQASAPAPAPAPRPSRSPAPAVNNPAPGHAPAVNYPAPGPTQASAPAPAPMPSRSPAPAVNNPAPGHAPAVNYPAPGPTQASAPAPAPMPSRSPAPAVNNPAPGHAPAVNYPAPGPTQASAPAPAPMPSRSPVPAVNNPAPGHAPAVKYPAPGHAPAVNYPALGPTQASAPAPAPMPSRSPAPAVNNPAPGHAPAIKYPAPGHAPAIKYHAPGHAPEKLRLAARGSSDFREDPYWMRRSLDLRKETMFLKLAEKPQLFYDKFVALNADYQLTWNEVQMFLQLCFTTKEMTQILANARELARRWYLLHPRHEIYQCGREAVPDQDPYWDLREPVGRQRRDHFVACIAEGIREYIAKKPNQYKRVWELAQKEQEDPAEFLDRLREALHKYSSVDPDSPEGQALLGFHMLTQSAYDIRSHLQTLHLGPDTTLDTLKKEAFQVYDNRANARMMQMAKILQDALQVQGRRNGRPRVLGPNQCAYCLNEGHWKYQCPWLLPKIQLPCGPRLLALPAYENSDSE